MKSIKIVLFLAFLMHFQFHFSCINGATHLLKNGAVLYEDHEEISNFPIPEGHHFFTQNFEKIYSELNQFYKKTNDLAYLSDIGVVLLLQKKYEEAIAIYKKIESKNPGLYATSSNLGTIYELMGNNEEALKWIENAVRINPKSHYGSEFIHANILKAKIKGFGFSSHNLIETNFGYEDLPSTKLSKKELIQLRNQIYFQLNERISFIKNKDKSISMLLFDLASIDYLLGLDAANYEKLFQMAVGYGFDKVVVHERLKAINDKKNNITITQNQELIDTEKYKIYFIYFLVGVLVLRLTYVLLKYLQKLKNKQKINENN